MSLNDKLSVKDVWKALNVLDSVRVIEQSWDEGAEKQFLERAKLKQGCLEKSLPFLLYSRT